MDENGLSTLDGIGEIFHSIYTLLKDTSKPKHETLDIYACNPALSFDKYSAMFIHDLVFFSGPILHVELIEILKIIFGKHDFKLKEHLAILVAFDSVLRAPNGLYKSALGKTYYKYKYDISSVIAIFRNYLIKNHPERIYEH